MTVKYGQINQPIKTKQLQFITTLSFEVKKQQQQNFTANVYSEILVLYI